MEKSFIRQRGALTLKGISVSVMRITASAPAFVMIDGSAAGIVEVDGFMLPVSGREMVVQLFPFKGSLLPFTCRVSLEPPRLLPADGSAELMLLPGELKELSVRFFSAVGGSSLPHVLASLPIVIKNRSLRATIYFDRCHCLAVEEEGSVIFCREFFRELESARLSFHGIGGIPVLAAEGLFDGGAETVLLRLADTPLPLLEREAAETVLDDRGVSLTVRAEGCPDAVIRETFRAEGGALRPAGAVPANGDARSVFFALIKAVEAEDEQCSLSLLSPALLRDVGFAELKDFLGGFERAVFRGEEAMLLYREGEGVFRGRLFGYSVKKGLIENISET